MTEVWDGGDGDEKAPTLRVRFSPFHEDGDTDGDEVDLDPVRRVLQQEFSHLERQDGLGPVTVEETGVGASGVAFEVVLEIARAYYDDAARLVGLGGWILWLVDKVRKRGGPGPTIADDLTRGAVAAAAVQPSTDLTGRRFDGTTRLTNMHLAPDETDERDLWAATFVDDEGDALVVFMSSSGAVIGQVRVPLLMWLGHEFGQRSPDDARTLYREWNGRGPDATG